MASEPIDVFAYGSNMLTRRIQDRCPSARAHGVAEFRGYTLRWNKQSLDGSGKCNVETDGRPASVVGGVLFTIARDEKPLLDRAEGLGNGYAQKHVSVLIDDLMCSAALYYATRVEASLKPYGWYKALVVAGAREHALPSAYIEKLEDKEAIDDSDRMRHREGMAMVNGSKRS